MLAQTRTPQQQHSIDTVIEAARNGGSKNFCVRARAGTGKTSNILDMVDEYAKEFPQHEIAICAFAKPIAEEVKGKLIKRGHDWRKVLAGTIHSFGFSLVRFVYKLDKNSVDEKKVIKLIEAQNDAIYREHGGIIARLVSLAKLEGFGFFDDCQIGDIGAWYRIADHYDINGFDDTTQLDDVIACAQHIYRVSLNQVHVIDYDDMILFPLVKNIRVKFQKNLLIVDEYQDTGRARQALLTKFLKPKGIMVGVGDDRQAIFGFAGAQSDALEKYIEQFHAEVLPLTVSWRCPINVIKEAQRIVPDIEWAPNAIEGEVHHIDKLPDVIEKTDAILCRNTAPLIEEAYALLRRSIGCKVEGREIGSGLLRLINRWKVSTIDAFLRRLDGYQEREVQKALAKGKENKAEEVSDRCETVRYLCRICIEKQQTSLDDVRAFIDSMFSDNVKQQGLVTLATYHRSKGREWPRVFLIEHSKRCPSPWAKQEWQKKQEENLAYVAITRAQQQLNYVR